MIDIDETIVFGTAGTPSTKMRARKLKLNNPRISIQYLKMLNKYYAKHKVFKKVLEMNKVDDSSKQTHTKHHLKVMQN